MKTVNDLKKGDYIAFGFNYNGGKPKEIIVDNITKVYEKETLVHFMYGHKSLSEIIRREEILAIGNNDSGKDSIRGWKGKYDILQPKKLEKILNYKESCPIKLGIIVDKSKAEKYFLPPPLAYPEDSYVFKHNLDKLL